jgi:hypothetical protein
MSTNNSLLPKEAVALVQHIELNKAGWWDKAVHRLVLACVWLSDEAPNAGEIQVALKGTFKLSLGTPKLTSALASLESRKMLLRLPSDTYRIPEEQRVIFEREIAASEKAEGEAKDSFCKLVAEMGLELQPEAVWAAFEHEFLGPLIKQVGANAYRLVAGEKMTAEKALVDHFLKPFSSNVHSKLRTLVTTFLDPKKPEVCAHISRMLHARFCVEASGLPEDVLAKLNDSVGKPIRFQMFVDTNFLFSLLDLHENPSNAAAQELRELLAQLNGNPRVDLFITPDTIEEAKRSIVYTKGQLSGLSASPNFTDAALHARFSGMVVRFLSERLRRNGRLTAEDWFDPFLTDFVPMARNKNVEIFNEKLDGYSTCEAVVDDINLVLKYEEQLPEYKRKSYAKVAHDMVLWHFVNDRRPAYVESPIEATSWILTVDFRLIGFDEHKQKHSKSRVPICIHPASLVQLLQFWVPRTKEFEEAMLGSLRLPFLFQDFDVEGEKTSLKILRGIGRFEGSEGLSQDTITHVMFNDGLRSRLQAEQSEEEEVALIRDALVEEMRLRAEEEASKAKALEEEVRKRDSDIATLADQKRAFEVENAQTKRAKEEADEAARLALASQGAELGDMKTRLQAMEEAELRRVQKEQEDRATREKKAALSTYLGCLIVVITLSAVGASRAAKLFPWYAKILGSIPTGALICIFTFVLGHLVLELSICRRPAVSKLWPFRQVKRFSRLLWAIVILGFFVGVGGNIYANWIQKNLDAENSSPAAGETKLSAPPDSK